MKTFKEFISENNQLDEKMGKLKTALAAGLIGAVAGHTIAKHDDSKPTITQTVSKQTVPKRDAREKKNKDDDYTNAAMAGIIGQM